MKEIKLTQGKVALVDDEDYEYLNQFKWYAHKKPCTFYAERSVGNRKNRTLVRMHRVIMNTHDNMQVDHIDHNGLNNQKCNLRNCTASQNRMNKRPFGKSIYKGVGFNEGLIQARIRINNKQIHLGYFKSEELAAKSYDIAAKKYHGEFANLNFK
jgi:hypothetical protein